ncbi:MAG: repair protein [Gammaproteobacteria bacterium]|jgi:probable DNA repair protein|nr:repair protein [Gammaproteobacteria bacterium]
MHYTSLFEAIRTEPSLTVLTVNQRLSQFLLSDYEAYRSKQPTSGATPDILPYSAWLKRCIINPGRPDLFSGYTLLSEMDESTLWEQCLKEEDHPLAPSALASLVQEAWQRLCEWQVPELDWQQAARGEQRKLIGWIKCFESECKNKKLLPAARFLDALLTRLLENNIPLPRQLIFVGFHQKTPALQRLCHVLQQKGHHIGFYETPAQETAAIQTFICQDPLQEYRKMAEWAYEILHNDQNAFIGCIVPDLPQSRRALLRAFNETAHPFINIPGACEESLSFNISYGEMLIHYPIIYTALLWLKLSITPLSVAEWQVLLDSPYLGDYSLDYALRAQLIRQLQKQTISSLSLAQFTALSSTLPLWQMRLDKINALSRASSFIQAPSLWRNEIKAILQLSGWPGQRTLNSTEYQALQRFEALLEELQALDLIMSACTFKAILYELKKRATNTLFQPQSVPARIQIIGVLEAAGLPFTHVWFAHADAAKWPPSPNPNPFIPFSVQRQYGLPHCDALHESRFAKTIMKHLKEEAGQLFYSYSIFDKNTQQLPSPLLVDFPSIELDPSPLKSQGFQASKLSTVDDTVGKILQNTQLPGGTGLFKEYAACPFKAYIKYRLKAEAWPSQSPGFSTAFRGQLIHKALELAWKELKDHAALTALSPEDQQQKTTRWAASALSELAVSTCLTSSKRLLKLELERLSYLINNWLNYERKRPPFSVIALESAEILKIGDFKISVRQDRLDSLDDGERCLIDYKTGNDIKNLDGLFGDRPDEPQLAIYCSISEKPINNLAFAKIHHEKLQFFSLVKKENLLPHSLLLNQVKNRDAEEWELQLNHWKNVFLSQADAIAKGHALIDPKEGKKTCEKCQFGSICRYSPA